MATVYYDEGRRMRKCDGCGCVCWMCVSYRTVQQDPIESHTTFQNRPEGMFPTTVRRKLRTSTYSTVDFYYRDETIQPTPSHFTNDRIESAFPRHDTYEGQNRKTRSKVVAEQNKTKQNCRRAVSCLWYGSTSSSGVRSRAIHTRKR